MQEIIEKVRASETEQHGAVAWLCGYFGAKAEHSPEKTYTAAELAELFGCLQEIRQAEIKMS